MMQWEAKDTENAPTRSESAICLGMMDFEVPATGWLWSCMLCCRLRLGRGGGGGSSGGGVCNGHGEPWAECGDIGTEN
jgi:hypothetical protein